MKLAVAVLLEGNDSFLMIRRKRPPGIGLWAFPGGLAMKNESAMAAAFREVFEELGLKIRIVGLIGVYSENDSQIVLIVYAARSLSLDFKINLREVQEVQFFDPKNIPNLAFKRDRKIISDWLICKRFDVWVRE